MNPPKFLAEIRQWGAVLRLEGDQIRCRAPHGVMTEKTPRYMRKHKDALIALLQEEAATDPDGLRLRSAITLFDADFVERRQEWSARGGANSSNRARAKKSLPANVLTMPEVQGLLSVTMKATLAGKVEPGVANAVANLARTMAQVAGVADIEEQIADLRHMIEGHAS